MYKFLNLLVIGLFIFFNNHASGLHYKSTFENYLQTELISKKELIQDIHQFIKLIDEVHGNPYLIISKNEFSEKSGHIINEIQLSDKEYFNVFESYFYLQKIAALVRDGHTLIRKPKGWGKYYKSLFPLILELDGKDYRVEYTYGSENWNGRVILKINGIPLGELKSKSIPYISGTLEHYLDSRFGKELPFLIQVLFKYEAPWIVEYKYESEIQIDTLYGVTREEFLNCYYERRPGVPKIKEEIINGVEVPTLDVPTFSFPNYETYTNAIDSFFKVNKSKETIAIDVRKNPGGNGIWSLYILDYFTNDEYSTYDKYENRISKEFKKWSKHEMNKYFNSQGKSPLLNLYYRLVEKEFYLKKALRSKTGSYIELDTKLHKPHKKIYYGNVYLIISEETFSAGVVFASIFKAESMGRIMGKETGGRLLFNSDPINIELKNTKLLAKIPTAILKLPGEGPDRGVTPNFNKERKIQGNYFITINQDLK